MFFTLESIFRSFDHKKRAICSFFYPSMPKAKLLFNANSFNFLQSKDQFDHKKDRSCALLKIANRCCQLFKKD